MLRALALVSVLLAEGCVAYNDQCAPLVDNPDEKIARLGETVYMDRPNTRHANNAFGQVFAESFVDVLALSLVNVRLSGAVTSSTESSELPRSAASTRSESTWPACASSLK